MMLIASGRRIPTNPNAGKKFMKRNGKDHEHDFSKCHENSLRKLSEPSSILYEPSFLFYFVKSLMVAQCMK